MEIRRSDRLAKIQTVPTAERLLSVDFDGVLSHLISEPELATADINALSALEASAQHGPTAIVSGRQAGFLHDRVPLTGIWKVGLYGRHWITPTGEPEIDSNAKQLMFNVREARAEVREQLIAEGLLTNGVYIEDRDGLVLSVHHGRPLTARIRELEDTLRTAPSADTANRLAELREFKTYAGARITQISREVASRHGLACMASLDRASLLPPTTTRAAHYVSSLLNSRNLV